MRIFVVIAAYNEEKKIGRVLVSLKKKGYSNIIVVDDGSADKTFEVASHHAIALQHALNRGQGAALKTGIMYALEAGADIIVTYDADGQFIPEDIEKVVSPVEENSVDIALGSRFIGKAQGMPALKWVVLQIGRVVVLCLYGIYVTDSQCGLRAMSRKAALAIEITSDRMEHAGEFFSEISRKRLKYVEVPVTVIYDDYSIGKGQDWSKSFGLGLKMLLKRLSK